MNAQDVGPFIMPVADFIHHVEHHPVHVGMKRAVALAVQAVRIGPSGIVPGLDGRVLVELGVFPQEGVGLLGPGLMTQQVHLRHQADTVPPAGGRQFFGIIPGKRVFVPQFRMLPVLIVPVHSEDEEIDSGRSKVLVDKTDKLFHPGPGRFDMKGKSLLSTKSCGRS